MVRGGGWSAGDKNRSKEKKEKGKEKWRKILFKKGERP